MVIVINKAKILFVYPYISSFIKEDLEILQRNFETIPFRWTSLLDLINIVKLLQDIRSTDLSFIWFADIYATFTVFVSKLFGKKSIVVVGGFDVANVPEINYGLMRKPLSTYMVKFILKNADKILTVDESLKEEAITNAKIVGNNILTVPTGYYYEKFKPATEKKNMVMTVSVGYSWDRVRLKGIDVFVETANLLPDVQFIIIGLQGEALNNLKSMSTSNVKFIPQLPHDELITYYQKAKVYCQLSMREGLPNALCEAMLCECVSVGSNVQGIRTAIGDTGFYVPYGNPEATAVAIKKALESDKGKDARERIKKMFPIERREKELIGVIKEMMDNI